MNNRSRIITLVTLLSVMWLWMDGSLETSAAQFNDSLIPPMSANGDIFADLVVGVNTEEIGGIDGAGMVNVLFGTISGLSGSGSQFWHQDSTGIQDSVESYDSFGYALAAGDFDGDGYVDLAVGVRNEAIGSVSQAGAVNILYSSAGGPSDAGNQFWHQDSTGILDGAEQDDNFGSILATGDFNGDGYADLAVGVPNEDIGSVVNAGAVNVLYGTAAGLSEVGNQLWHQDSPGILTSAEVRDYFGSALATGDFNGDGYADLAVGVPNEDVLSNSVVDAGLVNVIYGSQDGLKAAGNQSWYQDSPGILGGSEDRDYFGSALATGDFDGDGYADLAVGVPKEDIVSNSIFSAGMVNVIYGSQAGLTEVGDQVWDQETNGIQGIAEEGESFGSALTTGDFNGDGYDDLVVGVGSESIETVAYAGAVNVIYGSQNGLSEVGDQFWHQDSPGILDIAEDTDYFGSALSACDFDGDGYADLAVGVYSEEISSAIYAGAVNVLYGSLDGISTDNNQFWNQDSTGILDDVGDDRFGWSLACMPATVYRMYLPVINK